MKNFATRIAIIVSLAASSLCAFGQEAPTLRQLEAAQEFEKVKATLDQIEATLDSATKKRELDCARAFGFPPFCACILKDLPVAWSFADYVAITTRSKEENEYSKLSADYKSAYDKVAAIRDKCVRAINAGTAVKS